MAKFGRKLWAHAYYQAQVVDLGQEVFGFLYGQQLDFTCNLNLFLGFHGHSIGPRNCLHWLLISDIFLPLISKMRSQGTSEQIAFQILAKETVADWCWKPIQSFESKRYSRLASLNLPYFSSRTYLIDSKCLAIWLALPVHFTKSTEARLNKGVSAGIFFWSCTQRLLN